MGAFPPWRLLLDACKIDPDVAANMRGWRHSGFNVDNSVRIEAGDHAGMQRLVEYISGARSALPE
jgi:hypothetical protein